MSKNWFNKYIRCGIGCVWLIFLFSCATPMDIAYFQDAAALDGMALQPERQFRLRPEDKINIVVNSSNPMLEQQFTLTTATRGGAVLGAEVAPITSAGGSGNSQVVA